MPAILKRHVDFELQPGDDEPTTAEARAALAGELRRLAVFLNERADELDGDVLLTIQQAAHLAGRSNEAVRIWTRHHGIGVFDPTARRHMIRRSALVAHILATQGVLPAGLRVQNLSPPKPEAA